MFTDFINQTIYGDKGMYLSHFTIDKEVTEFLYSQDLSNRKT